RSSRCLPPPSNQGAPLCLYRTAHRHSEHVYQISYFSYPFHVSARRTLRLRLRISNILSCFPRKVKKNSAPWGEGAVSTYLPTTRYHLFSQTRSMYRTPLSDSPQDRRHLPHKVPW